MIDTLKSLAHEQKNLSEKFKTQGENLVRHAFTEFFKKYPEVQAVKWVQYTPFFNDGEPCIFRMGEFEVLLTDAGSDDEYVSTYSLNEPIKSDIEELEKQIQSIDDHLEAIFGEHAEVVVTPTDIDIREYEHD